MQRFLTAVCHILHPLFLPTITVALYFYLGSRYVTLEYAGFKLLGVVIMTLFIPMLVYLLLRTSGRVSSLHLPDVAERRWVLAITVVISILVALRVFQDGDFPEVYGFFIGSALGYMSCWALSLLGYKASLHMLAMSMSLAFFIALSISQGNSLLSLVALFALGTGLVGTSRLLDRAHSPHEIVVGTSIGILSQLLAIQVYL